MTRLASAKRAARRAQTYDTTFVTQRYTTHAHAKSRAHRVRSSSCSFFPDDDAFAATSFVAVIGVSSSSESVFWC